MTQSNRVWFLPPDPTSQSAQILKLGDGGKAALCGWGSPLALAHSHFPSLLTLPTALVCEVSYKCLSVQFCHESGERFLLPSSFSLFFGPGGGKIQRKAWTYWLIHEEPWVHTRSYSVLITGQNVNFIACVKKLVSVTVICFSAFK